MFYYDRKGRLVQTVERNHLGGISRYSNKYDFVGNVLASHESHQKAADFEGYDTKTTEFTYDHRSRLLTENTSVNGSENVQIAYHYNELGQLVMKIPNANGSGIPEYYYYNIQGWLTQYNNAYFMAMLRYYDPLTDTRPSYTGNISEWVYGHTSGYVTNGNYFSTLYRYDYDKLGRLKGYISDPDSFLNDIYTEQGIEYDANGNILQLTRYDGNGIPTEYTYQYNGNQLMSLNGNYYDYDMNGNMTHDGMRGVDLEYNSLNLIKKVSQGNTANATYRWLADGTKAGVTDNEGNGFEYLGSFVYQRDAAGLNLESTSFGAGRFVASSTGEMTPYYHITDHLGSVRTIFTMATLSGKIVTDSITVVPGGGFPGGGGGLPLIPLHTIVAQNDYFPFGLKHENTNLAQHTSNRYLYNGKEEQTTGGVDLLDYGARMYDATLGRWHSVDPMATNYTNYSPYVYCANSPIRMIDPNGMRFEEGMQKKYITPYLKQINNRILDNNQKIRELRREQHFAKMRGRNIDNMVYESAISMYQQDNDEMLTIRLEIYDLIRSDQMYHISFTEALNNKDLIRSGVGYNFNNGIFHIFLGSNDTHMLAHELKHAYQFEIGAHSTVNTRGIKPLLYDQHDEVEAYRRGGLFWGDPFSEHRNSYQQFQTKPVDVTNHPEIKQILNNPTEIQNYLNNLGHSEAFRVNGVTYQSTNK